MKRDAASWFEIAVEDLDRAQAFYENILKTKLQQGGDENCKMGMFPFDEENGVGGALSRMEGCKPGPGGTMVYLNVEGDLDGVLQRIPDAGGEVIQPRMDISPHGYIGIFKDTEGNVVGLHSMT